MNDKDELNETCVMVKWVVLEPIGSIKSTTIFAADAAR